jgi:hypothetical protein
MILCNIGRINFLGHDCGTILRRCHTHLLNKRLLLDIFHIGHGTFSISAMVSAQETPISSPTAKLEGWYGSRADTRDDMEDFMS